MTGLAIALAVPGAAGANDNGDHHGGAVHSSGSMHGGSVRGGAAPGGPVRGGAVFGGPVRSGFVPGGSALVGSVSGPVRGGFVSGGSVPGSNWDVDRDRDHDRHVRGGHFSFGVWVPDYGWGDDYAPDYVDPAAAAGDPAASYWYYCQSPAGYYPYVAQCAVPWQPVPPG